MPLVAVNGVRLAYEDEASGPPLVLVHGSWTNRHGWDLVAPRLAERFRVVRHDRRGHSESEPIGGTLDDDARDIAALAETLDLGPFHMACSSQGGVVGLMGRAPRVLERRTQPAEHRAGRLRRGRRGVPRRAGSAGIPPGRTEPPAAL